MKLPALYARASNGKIKTWEVEVREESGMGVILTLHGYTDGKLTITTKAVEKGKNIGKKNETSPFEQACSQAKATFAKKQKKKYVEDIDKIDNVDILLPMKAHKFKERKHNIVYPCYTQPKLNDVHCLISKTLAGISFTSKEGNPFLTLSHLIPQLNDFMEFETILVGGLFHPEWTFQEIIRHVKKVRPTSPQLQFWVYDVAGPGTFTDRFQKTIYLKTTESLMHIVRTMPAYSEAEVMEHHKQYVKEGFEGTMIRNANGLYRFDFASIDLQKYKDFIDAEFMIIGGKDGTGSDKGCVIFKVQNGTGSFDVRPKGTVKERQKMFNDLPDLIGKQLTVRYQELSEDGVPIFPVGLAIRDYE